MHKTFWLVGKDGFDKNLPTPVDSDVNHGCVFKINQKIIFFILIFKHLLKSLDQELIRTLEKLKKEKTETITQNTVEIEANSVKNDPTKSDFIKTNTVINNNFAKGALNKNDSGFSEITTNSLNSDSPPPNNQPNDNLEMNPLFEEISEHNIKRLSINPSTLTTVKKSKRLTDVESIA